jgi:NADH-quinone oxidoreductase subunit G
MLNRGDKSVIAVSPGRELDNPLSGNVVDLCPVGALTHKQWRFNTRIWFTKQTDSICTGCSTGCNVKVAERDGLVTLVKGRRNDAVNKEWLCDEGRYGFGRFLPEKRVSSVTKNVGGVVSEATLSDVLASLKGNLRTLTILASPDLLVEEYYLLRQLMLRASSVARAVVSYRTRSLSPVEEILVSPDRASNFRGAQLTGIIGEDPQSEYNEVLGKIRRKEIESILILGDRAIDAADVDQALIDGLKAAKVSVGVLTSQELPIAEALSFVVPGRSILEKSGLLLNRQLRLQYTQNVVPLPEGTVPEWRFLALLSEAAGAKLVSADVQKIGDRELTRWYLATDTLLASQGLTIQAIKDGGVQLQAPSKQGSAEQGTPGSVGAPTAA